MVTFLPFSSPGFRGTTEGLLDFEVAVGSLTFLGLEEGAGSRKLRCWMLLDVVGRLVGWLGTTWRIITFSKWLITMVIVSPLTGVVGPLPNSL